MEERERACDEEVLLTGSDPEAFAEGILKICELYLDSPVPCVAGVTGANLKRRIEKIMLKSTGLRLSFASKAAAVRHSGPNSADRNRHSECTHHPGSIRFWDNH